MKNIIQDLCFNRNNLFVQLHISMQNIEDIKICHAILIPINISSQVLNWFNRISQCIIVCEKNDTFQMCADQIYMSWTT